MNLESNNTAELDNDFPVSFVSMQLPKIVITVLLTTPGLVFAEDVAQAAWNGAQKGLFIGLMFSILSLIWWAGRAVYWHVKAFFERRNISVSVARENPSPVTANFFQVESASLRRESAERPQISEAMALEASGAETIIRTAQLNVAASPENAQITRDEENAIYASIAEEIETGNTDKGLWTRLYAECDGDEKRTKVQYIKAKVAKLIASEQARLEAEATTARKAADEVAAAIKEQKRLDEEKVTLEKNRAFEMQLAKDAELKKKRFSEREAEAFRVYGILKEGDEYSFQGNRYHYLDAAIHSAENPQNAIRFGASKTKSSNGWEFFFVALAFCLIFGAAVLFGKRDSIRQNFESTMKFKVTDSLGRWELCDAFKSKAFNQEQILALVAARGYKNQEEMCPPDLESSTSVQAAKSTLPDGTNSSRAATLNSSSTTFNNLPLTHPLDFLKIPAVNAKVKMALGSNYNRFIEAIGVASPVITEDGSRYFGHGCLPHMCGTTEGAFTLEKNGRFCASIYNNTNLNDPFEHFGDCYATFAHAKWMAVLTDSALTIDSIPQRWGKTSISFKNEPGQVVASMTTTGNNCIGSFDGVASVTDGVLDIVGTNGDVCSLAVYRDKGRVNVVASATCQRYAGFNCNFSGVGR